ncbi:MAG: diguanylate cyclase [Thermoanaerobacteraceae bacterium]|nr:diguanylate cyclase [Thermoanaerobacteraceae bacterium]
MKIPHLLHTSLRTRFAIGGGTMLLLLVVLAASAFFSLQATIGAFEEAAEEGIRELSPLMSIQKLILRVWVSANDYLTHGNPKERERFVRLIQEADMAFEETSGVPFALTEEQALVRSAQKEWQRGRTIIEAILAVPQPVGDPVVATQMERFEAHLEQSLNILDQIYNLAYKEIEEELALAYAIKRKLLLIIATVFGVGVGATIIAAVAMIRSILLPLYLLEEAASRFGEGDLSHRVVLATRDELGQLAETLNAMAEKLEKSQAALEDLSIRDALTGLYNRREFQRRLKEEVERTRRHGGSFSLLMLDADHFKTINDTYGHQVGDEVLRVMATLICREVRPVDQVARYGGEEFAIILPETSASGALVLAERIRNVIANQAITVSQGQVLNLTVSIGVAAFPEDARSEEELIDAADQALYAAKHAGRNRACQFNKF